MTDLENYIISLNSQKALLRSFAGLSEEQTNTLVDLCFRKATTTIYRNSEITLHLLERYYLQLSSHKKTYDQIIGELTNKLS